jgi:hypothetical protein
MAQSHFTIQFPLAAGTDTKLLTEKLNAEMPALFLAADELGTVHYSRFTLLSEKTLLFLGDFDGDFADLMRGLTRLSGPLFDVIFAHVSDPPALPVAAKTEAFVGWMMEHLLNPLNVYSAYPGVTVKEIKALATAAGAEGGGEQRPFLVILPTRSRLAFFEIQLLLRARSRGIQKDLDSVGTPHFAQFMPLEDNQIGFFTVYDGSFDDYIADFTKNIGGVFDIIFKFTKNPPPSPCRKHLQEFIDFAAGANREPIGFYQAYPGLTVQDVHALVADREAGG